MNNRPFFSTNNFNITNESFSTTAPANLNGHSFLINQEQQREIKDTLNAALYPYHNCYYNNLNYNIPNNNNNNYSGQFMEFQKFLVPGGAVFSCNPSGFSQPTPMQISPGDKLNNNNNNDLQNYQLYNELQKCNLQNVQLQEILKKNQFQLKFHKNTGTDPDNLTGFPLFSNGTPDFQNICGINNNNSSANTPSNQLPNSSDKRNKDLENAFSNDSSKFTPPSTYKKLILSPENQPKRVVSHVFEILDENKDKREDNNVKIDKRVSFKSDLFKDCEKSNLDESCQASLCKCCVKNNIRRKRKKTEFEEVSSNNSSKCSLEDCQVNNWKSKGKKPKNSPKESSRNNSDDDDVIMIMNNDVLDNNKNETNKQQ